jgi:hypothetical protein
VQQVESGVEAGMETAVLGGSFETVKDHGCQGAERTKQGAGSERVSGKGSADLP